MSRRLILIRHAHRNKLPGRERDNGLSEKGRRQAQALAELWGEPARGERPLLVLSSPKRRCLETLDPLRRAAGHALVQPEPLLDEGPELDERAQGFLHKWRQGRGRLWLACTHGDWIPVFLDHAIGHGLELEKGGFAELELVQGRAQLRCLVQDPLSLASLGFRPGHELSA